MRPWPVPILMALLACGGEPAAGAHGDEPDAGGSGGSGGFAEPIEVEHVLPPPPLDEPGPGDDGPDGDAGPLPDGAAPDLVPCLVEFPEEVRLGILERGEEARGELAIRNLRADAACRVSFLGMAPGSDPEFAVEPIRQTWIPPAGELRAPFRFVADHYAVEFVAQVEFYVVDADGSPRRSATLRATVQEPCFDLRESEVAFGTVPLGCEPAERRIRLVHYCEAPVEVTALEVVGDGNDAFTLVETPVLPFTLTAREAHLAVRFEPEATGTFAGSFRITGVQADGRVRVREARLVGESVEREGAVTESYRQIELPKQDLLVVLDNGTTMGPESAAVIAELGRLPEILDLHDVDWQLAVTTTGLAAQPGGGCPGGVGGGEDGRLFPVDGTRPRIVTPATPDARAVWEANLAVGTCHTAPPQALEAAVRALTPPLATSADDLRHPEPADGNLGFLRPGAHLQLFLVSDRADASPGLDANYFHTLQALKGFRNTHLLSMIAITGDPGAGCTAPDGRNAVSGQRLADFAGRAEGGRAFSICGTGPWYGEFSSGGYGWKTCFFLHRPSEPDTLEVRVNGALVPAVVEGEPLWRFSAEQNAVCFERDHLPPSGATVDLTYLPACPP